MLEITFDIRILAGFLGCLHLCHPRRIWDGGAANGSSGQSADDCSRWGTWCSRCLLASLNLHVCYFLEQDGWFQDEHALLLQATSCNDPWFLKTSPESKLQLLWISTENDDYLRFGFTIVWSLFILCMWPCLAPMPTAYPVSEPCSIEKYHREWHIATPCVELVLRHHSTG